jgi:hypothetical protein
MQADLFAANVDFSTDSADWDIAIAAEGADQARSGVSPGIFGAESPLRTGMKELSVGTTKHACVVRQFAV